MRIWHNEWISEKVCNAPGWPNGMPVSGYDRVLVTKPNGMVRDFNAYVHIKTASEEGGMVEIYLEGEVGYVYGDVKITVWDFQAGCYV